MSERNILETSPLYDVTLSHFKSETVFRAGAEFLPRRDHLDLSLEAFGFRGLFVENTDFVSGWFLPANSSNGFK